MRKMYGEEMGLYREVVGVGGGVEVMGVYEGKGGVMELKRWKRMKRGGMMED